MVRQISGRGAPSLCPVTEVPSDLGGGSCSPLHQSCLVEAGSMSGCPREQDGLPSQSPPPYTQLVPADAVRSHFLSMPQEKKGILLFFFFFTLLSL